jgi:hypothetical protein
MESTIGRFNAAYTVPNSRPLCSNTIELKSGRNDAHTIADVMADENVTQAISTIEYQQMQHEHCFIF